MWSIIVISTILPADDVLTDPTTGLCMFFACSVIALFMAFRIAIAEYVGSSLSFFVIRTSCIDSFPFPFVLGFDKGCVSAFFPFSKVVVFGVALDLLVACVTGVAYFAIVAYDVLFGIGALLLSVLHAVVCFSKVFSSLVRILSALVSKDSTCLPASEVSSAWSISEYTGLESCTSWMYLRAFVSHSRSLALLAELVDFWGFSRTCSGL